MSVAELSPVDVDPVPSQPRRLFVVWQDPTTRKFAPVGALVRGVDGIHVFRYLRRALALPGFHPLTSFPELDRTYRSVELPSFFSNRVMSARRPDFADFVHAMDLDVSDATPFEVLARTGGGRATDTFHVVAEPEVSADGHVRTRFLASGVRWVEGASERVGRLAVGSRLRVRHDPTNVDNPQALLIDVAADEPVGYVPDWMLDVVHRLVNSDPGYHLVVEGASGPDTPSHLRLLCRLDADLPAGVQLFDDPDFDYVEG